MFTREVSIHIDAPPAAVYDYVSDIHRHSEFAMYPLTVRDLEGGDFESIVSMGPIKARSVIHVETANRPSRFVFVCADELSGPHRWHFEISPDGGGSKVKYGFERIENPLWIRILQPLVMYPLIGHPGCLKALANIKGTLEAGTQTSTSAPSVG